VDQANTGNGGPILVVEDDDVFRARLVRAFRDRGLLAASAADGVEAAAVAKELRPTRAVVDLRMPGEDGLEVLRRLLELDADTTVVILTGYGSIATAKDAIRLGAVDYLTKPVDTDQILAAFERGSAEPDGSPATLTAPSLARLEWEHIQRVLTDCDGNVSRAARVLGIHRRSLQRKLAKMPPPESDPIA
jgi:two-component system response regulator RegA